jgi:hypothetical protein
MGIWDDGDVVWIIAWPCPCVWGFGRDGSESGFVSVGSGLHDERSRERSYSFVWDSKILSEVPICQSLTYSDEEVAWERNEWI